MKGVILLQIALSLLATTLRAQEPSFIEHPRVAEIRPKVSSSNMSSSGRGARGAGTQIVASTSVSISDLAGLSNDDSVLGKLYRSKSRIEVIFTSLPSGAKVINGEDSSMIAKTDTRGSLEAKLLDKLSMIHNGKSCVPSELTVTRETASILVFKCDFEVNIGD